MRYRSTGCIRRPRRERTEEVFAFTFLFFRADLGFCQVLFFSPAVFRCRTAERPEDTARKRGVPIARDDYDWNLWTSLPATMVATGAPVNRRVSKGELRDLLGDCFTS